jgi:hypothetical protein
MPLLEFPPDLQRYIMGFVPLREMAQLACLNKELRSVYLERVKQRDAVVTSLLESHVTPDFPKGLSSTHTACAQCGLPRDLIVDSPVRHLSLCPQVVVHHVLHNAQSFSQWPFNKSSSVS